MKKLKLLALILTLVMLFQGMPFTMVSAAANDTIVLYPEFHEKIERDYMYRIFVSQGGDEYEIPVYNSMRHTNYFVNHKHGTYSDVDRRFCQFSATPTEDNPVTIKVVVNTDFDKFSIIPSSDKIQPSKIEGNEISFEITKSSQYMFRINDNNLTNLAIFADAVETDVPNKSASNVIVYNKNNPAPKYVSKTTANIIYYIEDWVDVEKFELKSNQQLYIAPGAVLNARVLVPDGQSNVTISGRGMLRDYNDTRAYNAAGEMIATPNYYYLLSIGTTWNKGENLTKNVTVKDIIVFDAMGFNVAISGAQSTVLDNIKIVSNEISTDGVSIWGSDYTKIRNSYIYIADNIFVIDQAGGLTMDNLLVGSSIATFFPQAGIAADHLYQNIDVFRSGTLFEPAAGFDNNVYDWKLTSLVVKNLSAIDCVAPVNAEGTSKMGKFFATYTSASGSANEKAITFENITLPEQNNSYVVDVGTNNAKAGNYKITLKNVYVGNTAVTQDNVQFTDASTSGKPSSVTVSNDGTYVPETRNVTSASYSTYKLATENLYAKTKYYYYSPAQPYVKNGVIYLSATAMAKMLGFDTYYDADDKSVTLYDEDTIIRATKDSNVAVHNDKNVTLSAVVEYDEELKELMLPADFFTATLKISITRDGKNIFIGNYDRAETLVNNGDFEDNNALESWTTINFARLTRSTVAHSGSYGLRFADSSIYKADKIKSFQGACQDVIDEVLLEGPGVYEISFWAKCNNTSVDLTDTSSYFITAGIGTGWMDTNAKFFNANKQALTTSWKQYKQQVVVTAASGDNSMYNQAMYAAIMIKGAIDVSVDDFTFTKVSAVPAATATCTLSLSDGTTNVNYGSSKELTASGTGVKNFTFESTNDYLTVEKSGSTVTVSVAYPSNFERSARIIAKNTSGTTVGSLTVTIPATATAKHVLDYDCNLVVDEIYKAGEKLDTSSLQLTNVKYNDGTTGTVDGSDVTVEYDFTTEGETVVTVTYDKKSVTYTTTVVDDSLIKISVLGANIRLETDEYSAGIRFGAALAKDNIYDKYHPTTDEEKKYTYNEANNYQFGTIMIPSRLVPEGSSVVEMHKAGDELVLDILGEKTYEQDETFVSFTGVLTGIPATKGAYCDDLECAFYVRVREDAESEWVYTYSTKIAEDCYFSVAEKAYLSTYNYGQIENPTAEEKVIIDALTGILDFVEEDLWIDYWA